MPRSPRTGLVLSGGGARGAYEAGVIAGIVEVLGVGESDPPPFTIFAGTSVGAINAAFLAANGDRGDLGCQRLIEIWKGLCLQEYLRFRPAGFLWRKARGCAYGPQLFDVKPFERLVSRQIDWNHLHDCIAEGKIDALVVAALDILDNRTTMFAELAPRVSFHPSRDPRRRGMLARIGPDHVLASSAIPLFFPARRVGSRYYVDGGVRFNTPLAPAIRIGADRLVVISLRSRQTRREGGEGELPDPSLPFLLGKLFNALLLDPIIYDLQILERFNRLLRVLDEVLTPEEHRLLDRVFRETRGVPYRPLDTLVFEPSLDIGRLAGEHLRRGKGPGRLTRRILSWFAPHEERGEADWASFILFDAPFVSELIMLGHHDALAQASKIQAFFDRDTLLRAGSDPSSGM
ncbi:MAG: hypothetical protein D6795_16240 [Deltaproteobacteria bacterium]|nr:MAG: hypothetical protein D6795_16240 [Deltaproteobacteria bacterium]